MSLIANCACRRFTWHRFRVLMSERTRDGSPLPRITSLRLLSARSTIRMAHDHVPTAVASGDLLTALASASSTCERAGQSTTQPGDDASRVAGEAGNKRLVNWLVTLLRVSRRRRVHPLDFSAMSVISRTSPVFGRLRPTRYQA
jgi:hypothetical protein